MKESAIERSLTQRTFLNAAAALLNYGVSIVVALILNPLLLTYLGASLFGTWKICQRLLTYVSATDGRASQALKWTIANRKSVSDTEQKQREIGCAIVVWLRFLPLILLAGALLSWFSPWFIRGLPREHFIITRLTCGILVFNLILHPVKSIPESVMVGMNLAYRTIWINSVCTLIGGILMAVAAWVGWGLVGLAGATMLASLFGGGATLYLAKRNLPWLAVQKPEKTEVSSFFNLSIWMLSWTFVNKLLLASDIVILGLISSASLVASYILTIYIIQTAVQFSTILVSSGMPGMGDLVGRGDFRKAASVRSEIMTSSWLLATVIGTMVLLWNRSFIGLWVGEEQFLGYVENFLMVIWMTQLIFITNDSNIVNVTLEIRTKVLLGALSTMVSLGLAFLFGMYFQSPAAGVLTGLIIGRTIISILYPMLVNKFLHITKKSIVEFVYSISRNAITMISMFLLSSYFSRIFVVRKWSLLLLSMIITLIFIIMFSFWIGLSKLQREKINKRLKQIPVKLKL